MKIKENFDSKFNTIEDPNYNLKIKKLIKIKPVKIGDILRTSKEKKKDVNDLAFKNDEIYNISYLPKRKVKFTPFSLISSSQHTTKLFDNEKENTGDKKINIQNGNNHAYSTTEKDYLEFKTTFILKFARNKKNYERLSQLISSIEEDKKTSLDYYRKLVLITDKKDRILFDSMNPLTISDQANLNSYINWKDLVVLFYESECSWLRLSEVVLKELSSVKEKNLHLEKKVSDQGHQIISKDSTIQRLNKFIEENDLNSKSSFSKKKITELDLLKEEFTQKENLNIYNVFRLEEE